MRILLAWELGGNLGHVTSLLALARGLRQRGHQVSFAVKDVKGCAQVLQQNRFAYVQAPMPSTQPSKVPRDPASYPEILLHYGFGDPAGLRDRVHAWRNLFDLAKPDLVVFDHSPTALLAARGLGVPRVLFGTGFASPPRVAPMSSFRPWQRVSMDRLQTSEQRVLDTINAVCRVLGAAPLEALYELFEVEEDILATLPELDHYRSRSNGRYWGPIFDADEGEEPEWPQGSGQKVFVYLRPTSRAFRPFASILRKARLRTLWFAPGLPADAIEQLQSPSLTFVSKPLRIPEVTTSADVAILHGGHGTTAAMLLGGIPLIVVPENIEQLLLARNVASLGAGAVIHPQGLGSGLVSFASGFLRNESLSVQARAFAAKYKDRDQSKELNEVIRSIDKLIKPKRSASPKQFLQSEVG
jgi:UDP:flavonoid glycosyltransferase YjiC (YdhE family)